ncbi:unnamed protein product [Durusdinium trenchii]|uniref:Uncharacterized protein n=1 Tax=Durusdinium trenchii TaxID=1381693 RepID=A0ABP0H7R2_9DINO
MQDDAGVMVNVLWGVPAMTMDGPRTAAEVVARFCHAMGLEDSPEASQHIDVYRVVPVNDQLSEFAEKEKLLVHLPASPFDCAAIEELHQHLEEMEIRNERCRESISALVEALRHEAPTDLHAAPSEEEMQHLRQENSTLRLKLEQAYVANRDSYRELNFLREVTPRHPVRQVPMGPASLSGWDGHVGSSISPVSMPCPMSTAPAVQIPAACLHGPQPGSNPVTPRVPQLRQLPPRLQMSAAAPSGPSIARMAQNAFTAPASVERIREPLNMAAMEVQPQPFMNVSVTSAAGRCTPTNKAREHRAAQQYSLTSKDLIKR